MRVLNGLKAVRRAPHRAVVTVGVFDGVHRAHQQVVRRTVAVARRAQGTAIVITFDPDPQVVLRPRQAPPALMPLELRLRVFEALGVDWVWVLRFSKTFARISARTFVERVLLKQLRARALIVGDGFVFGRDRRGTMQTLRALGPARGMQVIAVRPIRVAGVTISSSRIRRLIGQGKVRRARQLLGRPPALHGRVGRGRGRGRRLGCPTANLQLVSQVLPPRGVYAVLVRDVSAHRTRRSRVWRAVMNLGIRPTFGRGPMVCEVHLLNFRGSLRRRRVEVSLLAHLRAERRFASPAAPARQIQRDIARARRLV